MRKNGHKAKMPGRPLARPGDPYVTIWGEVVKPDTAVLDVNTAAKAVTPENFKPTKRRDAKDLPAPPPVLNAVACVFMYSILGLGDREIAEVMNVSADHVTKTREQAAYKECFEAVAQEFISANSELITARLAAYSHAALSQVANIAFNGKEERNRLRASGDILDRGGYAPRENAARGQMMAKNDLRIMVIKAEKDMEISIDGQEM